MGNVAVQMLILFCAWLAAPVDPAPELPVTENVEPSAESQALRDYVVAGWQAEREKVRRGEYVFSGKVRRSDLDGDDAPPERSVFNKITSGTIRFDRTTQQREQRLYVDSELKSYVALLPDRAIDWSPGLVASIRPPRDLESESGMFFLDADISGFGDSTRFEEGCLRESLIRVLNSKQFHAAAREETTGLYLLTFGYEIRTAGAPVGAVDEFRFDEAQGFALKSRVSKHRFAPGEETVVLEVNADWAQRDGLWLPVRCSFINRISRCEGAVTFDWKSVNAGDELAISVENSPIPDDALVADLRTASGSPITLGELGHLRSNPLRADQPAVPHFSKRTTVLWGVNFAGCVAIALYLTWRKRRLSRMRGQ